MPLISFSAITDYPFQKFTKIYSQDINDMFSTIQTFLNVTKLDSSNVQALGLVRYGASGNFAAGTANYVVYNDSSGYLKESQFLPNAQGGLGLDITPSGASQAGQALVVNSAGNGYTFSPSPPVWATYSLTIGGASSAPTKGTTTKDLAQWRRVGDSMEIRYLYVQTAVGSNGSGAYLFPLPPTFTIDTSKLPVSTSHLYSCGHGFGSDQSDGISSASRVLDVATYNSTNLQLFAYTSSNTFVAVDDGHFNLGNTNIILSFTALVPITQWA